MATEVEYREHRITARHGLRLYVRDYDSAGISAPTILCLGGLTRNSKDFHPLARTLFQDYRIIAPDYRGRGLSAYDSDPGNYQPMVYLDDIRNILAALNIAHVAVIGTSLGGLLAMGMAVAMPFVLKGALLNDVGPELPLDMVSGIIRYVSDRPVTASWNEAETHMMKTMPMMFFNDPVKTRLLVQNTFRERADGQLEYDWDKNITANISIGRVDDLDFWRMFDALRRLPVLSVRGMCSPFITDELWERMTKHIPHMNRAGVPDNGHAPMLTENEVERPLQSWLSQCFE